MKNEAQILLLIIIQYSILKLTYVGLILLL